MTLREHILTKKPCTKCGETKPTTEFSKNARTRDGLRPWCKACVNIYSAAYRAANPEKVKACIAKSRAANPEKEKERAAKWYAANRAKRAAQVRAYRQANPEKVEEWRRAYRQANPERMVAYRRAYKQANSNKVKAYQAAYYAANHDKCKAAQATWNAANTEAMRIHRQNRRAREREAGGKLSKGLAKRLFTLQHGKCACGCKQPLGTDYHLDHRMPLALGGTNTDDNMQLLTATCNLKKGAKHPVEFMQSNGFLL
jgi:hypothetical protein